MYSDAEEANSQAKEKQEEHRLAERQLSETKTRQTPYKPSTGLLRTTQP